MTSSKQAERAGGNGSSAYHDPVLSSDSEDLERVIEEDGEEAAIRLADQLRFSSNRSERIRSAVAYSIIAKKVSERSPRDAVYQYHYSGQGFRLEGMTSKAGRNYEKSADLGREVAYALYKKGEIEKARSLQDFNCRSIGRAVNCYQDSGQFDFKLRCQRKSNIALSDMHVFKGAILQNIATRIWSLALDYSLSWSHGYWVLFFFILVSILLPVKFGAIAISLGSIAFLSVCIRRLS